MAWFSRFLRKSVADRREAVLNDGLRLAMEFGQDWLKPIQLRLSQLHPELTPAELDRLNETCRSAMSYGHKVTYEQSVSLGAAVSVKTVAPVVHEKFAWVNEENMAHLFSQGMYYAYKDGAVQS
jgi:hypothetical protein